MTAAQGKARRRLAIGSGSCRIANKAIEIESQRAWARLKVNCASVTRAVGCGVVQKRGSRNVEGVAVAGTKRKRATVTTSSGLIGAKGCRGDGIGRGSI